MNITEFRVFIDTLNLLHISFSMDWGSEEELHSSKHREYSREMGWNCTQLAFIAVVIGNTKFVFTVTGGKYLFRYDTDGTTTSNYVPRDQKITLDEAGFNFIEVL